MSYTTISVKPEIKKELLLARINKNFKTWEDFFKDVINKYKKVKKK